MKRTQLKEKTYVARNWLCFANPNAVATYAIETSSILWPSDKFIRCVHWLNKCSFPAARRNKAFLENLWRAQIPGPSTGFMFTPLLLLKARKSNQRPHFDRQIL